MSRSSGQQVEFSSNYYLIVSREMQSGRSKNKRLTHECVSLLAGEYFPRQYHPLNGFACQAFSLPGAQIHNE